MKLTLKKWLIAILSAVFLAAAIWAVAPAIAASADTGDLTCETASGNYLNEDYLAVYRVPASMMTYEANGGGNIANAFDGNWNSFWQTNIENNGQNTNTPTFLNAITVTFSQPVTIDRIAYASSSERLGHGYPITLNLYTSNSGELSLYGTCDSTATNDRVVFRFKETITVTQIKFEFRKVNTMHNWTATAKEICFLQPDNASANKVIDLFNDYAQLSVKSEYKSNLNAIREDVSSLISYESALKPLLDRADAILNGHLIKNTRREFSTDPNAINVINQYGNLRSYAGGTLKMSSFGIDRQVTGVGGLKGDTITVYVEADEGDPLPRIAFTQIIGDWRSWQSSYNLTRGKNVLTFPNFITDNYTRATIAGGAIHILNQYEPTQQSKNVKVYIEGGFLYPVFRKGGDVEAYRMELTSYQNEMNNTEGMCNITELVGDHFINTLGASTAYNDYVVRNIDPQKNAEGWDGYMTALLEFGGVTMDPQGKYFNEKNLHLYTNFRMVQPWAGAFAFAAGDHLGFIDINESSLTNFGNLGWGFAHEVGHALDVGGRTIGETTNNMWSKFALAYFEGNVSRNFNNDTTNALTSDENYTQGFFNTNRYNYQIWWNLEACHHGFWGELDNLYRYYDETAARNDAGVTSDDKQMDETERMVYYSSLVMGEDLGYYYERFGFSFTSGDNYKPFKVENASASYKKLVQKALDDKKIELKNFKYWYIDADQYYYDFTGNDYYEPSVKVEIDSANKTDAGYVLYLTLPEGTNAHIGYEIMEYRGGKWSVIGFTKTSSFTDTTQYPAGYVPQYKIKGYDRELSVSAESTPKNFNELKQSGVCKIGNTYYNSLTEAVAGATAGDTIYICAKMYDAKIVIDKNLTILPDPSLSQSLLINKASGGVLIQINSGATLTLGSQDGATIILDGNRFSQNGSLIQVNNGGKLIAVNIELRNNINTEHGGGLFVNGGTAQITNVTMKGNSVTGNDRNGGAVANFGGTLTMTDCTLIGNSTNTNGGALTLDGNTTLVRCIIKDNTARDKGGAMFIACNGGRTVTAEDCEISGNTAKNAGGAIYLGKGKFTIIGGSATKISGELYRGETAFVIEKALPDLSNVTFKGSFTKEEEKALLTASGDLTFTEDFRKSLKTGLAVTSVSADGKTISAKINTATVTLSINGKTQTEEVAVGDYVLPTTVEGLGEDKYISSWTSDGNSYPAGETVKITADSTFTAVIGTKFKVTLKYTDDHTQTFYVEPDGKFYLPDGKEFGHYTILGWQIGSDGYEPFAGVTITADTVIQAVMETRFTVTIDDKGEKTEQWLEYGSSIVLTEAEAPEGKQFLHWDVNGVAYKAGDTVIITGDTIITAVFDNAGKGKANTLVIVIVIVVVLLVIAGLVVALVFVIKHGRAKDGYDYEEDEDEGEEE
ncbi:MAG: M60 family metallopeptidase [Clostridia bacterium]|nr:M60 family metallopeptidase [Clostridia bacterium]